MIGNRDVIQTNLPRRDGHSLDACRAVAPGGMDVKVTPEVSALDEKRQPMAGRGLNLAAVFPQLRGHPLQPQRLIDVLFGFASDSTAGRVLKNAVLVHLQTHSDRDVSKGDVVQL